MSRHEVPARKPGQKVFIGWDHPLLTFFGQVYDEAVDEDENPVVWVGTSRLRGIYEIEDLVRVMGKHAVIDADMRTKLYSDKDEGR